MEDLDLRILLAQERTDLAKERNRLSNERTFLAWTRTGLASVGGGLAIIRFLTFQHLAHQIMSQTIGGVLVILGIIIFVLSFLDYKNSYKKLKIKDGYVGSVWSMSIISFVLILVSIILSYIAFNMTESF